MDIVIKSFNRPYYLERCLRSIYSFVTGDFTVRILDDGTPSEYLDKIADLYPTVLIARSPAYEQKAAAILAHVNGEKKYDQFFIPTAFWIEQVELCSDVFLLLEDDIWLTAPLSLPDFQLEMQTRHIAMVKISWLGNNTLVEGEKRQINEHMEEIVPAIPFASQAIFLNKYRIRSVLYRLGILRLMKSDFKYQLPFYSLYSVASAFFDKQYWLYLWNDALTKVDEGRQLRKAAHWLQTTKSHYAKTKTEVSRTSFITSATNEFKEANLDVIRFNHHLNQAWLRDELDAMQNFPADFEHTYLGRFLDAAQDERSTYAEWLKWIKQFKLQYQRIGCEVD
jgi:glycosyltransferase involved in cell wall biosynthesis